MSRTYYYGPSQLLWGAVALAGLAQSVAGAAGALLAEQVSGSAVLAGGPQTMLVIGAAGSALPLAALATHAGRAVSLAAGCLVGAVGCLVVVASVMLPIGQAGSVAGLLLGSVLLGAGNTAVMLARYAGAQLRPDLDRGRALAAVLTATSVGAVVGPNLLTFGARLTSISQAGHAVPDLTGAYAISATGYVLAAAMIWMLRPALRVTAAPVVRSSMPFNPVGRSSPA